MSEPAPPKSIRLRQSGSGAVSDGTAPASPRQVARLRFLGVAFREPLTIAQAGVHIDRTNADPGFAARIEEWHTRKFELHPTLYPAATPAAVVPDRQISGAEFHLPPRGADEQNATIFQKRRLELFGGCDLPVIDSLGREQAGVLITFLEAQSVARSLERLRVDAEARQKESHRPQVSPADGLPPPSAAPSRPPPASGRMKWVLLASAALIGGGLFFLYGSPLPRPDAGAAATEPTPATATSRAGPTASVAAASPRASSAVPFAQAVAASQARAVKKYPALGQAGSRFNTAFVARYQLLSKQRSALLTSPDWPEKLADECAAQVPAKAR